jgi:hypothetical protein
VVGMAIRGDRIGSPFQRSKHGSFLGVTFGLSPLGLSEPHVEATLRFVRAALVAMLEDTWHPPEARRHTRDRGSWTAAATHRRAAGTWRASAQTRALSIRTRPTTASSIPLH